MEKDEIAILLGKKISQLRESRGLSIRKLSKIIGISDTALAKIESGSTKSITIDLGKGISKALGVSFNELFEIQTDNQSVHELEKEIDTLKEQLGIKNREALFYVNINERLETEIESLRDSLITWPEYYLLGFLNNLRNDLKNGDISEDQAVERTNLVFNIVAMAFLFSTQFKIKFIDQLEKRLKKTQLSSYEYDFKPFIEMLRAIEGDYKDFEKE